VGQRGSQQVGLDRGRDQGAGPFENGGDDQGRGLVAAGGAEDQHRVAVLGGQQPPERARGTAQDHPTRLRLAHGQQPQLPTARPGGGMLGRPWVPRPMAGHPPRQVPQDRGRPAREAADQANKRPVHAGGTGQRAAHVGGPGQGRVTPVLRQLPEDMGDVGWGELQPGVTEGQAGGLPGGPHQRPSTRGSTHAYGEELVAGAGERRRVRRSMATGRKRRPGVMPHRPHPPTWEFQSQRRMRWLPRLGAQGRPLAPRSGRGYGSPGACLRRFPGTASWGQRRDAGRPRSRCRPGGRRLRGQRWLALPTCSPAR
jgi:hypothetical protein